ncbi:MAG: MBL fold metallo-hydrolase [Treponema sp.]|nr:MBL fold metallo-hydrolase [Treponema sp.]
MELKKLSEHIWYMPYESERDRPNLGYVKGENWSLAIDAGHSDVHVKEFYALLEKENLPLPKVTVLTHWHWDHTFGMHAVNGLCIANKKTDAHLVEWKNKIESDGPGEFLAIDQSIRIEYANDKKVIVKPADILFSGELTLDLGGCKVQVVESEAPHTEDSTLVYVVEDKVLFLGDSTCNDFQKGTKDPVLCQKLADKIKAVNPETCVEGHWVPVETSDTLNDLFN